LDNKLFGLRIVSKAVVGSNLLQEKKTNYKKAIPSFMYDSETGGLIKLCWMHEEWHDLLDTSNFSFIAAPRDHGKSVQVVTGRVACEIGNNPNIRIKIISGTEDLAKKRVKAIKDIIENSPEYHELYGKLKPAKASNWGDLSFTVKRNIPGIKESTLEAFGIMGTATGDRADLVVCDDIVTFENSIGKPSQRIMIKKKFWGDIVRWVVPKVGRLWYICTIWHQDDLSSEIMGNIHKNRFNMKFYAINENCDPIWEERYDKKYLLTLRAENPAEFDRAYRNMPISDEDTIFKRGWVQNSIRIDDTEVLFNENTKIYVGVDLAISKKTTADYTVIMVLGIDSETDKMFPIEMVRKQGMSSPETARAVLNIVKKWRPSLVYVENNAYQSSLLEWMEDLQDTEEWKSNKWIIPNVMGFRTGSQKHDMFEGLPSMANEFHNGLWTICNHKNPLIEGESPCDNDNCMCKLIDELIHYPFGTKDDCVMSLWLARMAAKKDLSFFFTYA